MYDTKYHIMKKKIRDKNRSKRGALTCTEYTVALGVRRLWLSHYHYIYIAIICQLIVVYICMQYWLLRWPAGATHSIGDGKDQRAKGTNIKQTFTNGVYTSDIWEGFTYACFSVQRYLNNCWHVVLFAFLNLSFFF